jgi:amidase
MKTWKDIAAAQQAKRQNRIPKEWLLKNPPADDVYNVMDIPYTCGIMSPEELKITEKDCVELLDLMANKKLKSYDVTLAFCKRAAIAQQLVSCFNSPQQCP